MSQPSSSSQNRRRKQSSQEVTLPTMRRAPRRNARQRVTGDSAAPPLPDRVDLHATWKNSASVEDDLPHQIQRVHTNDLAAEYTFVGSPKESVKFYTALSNARVKACIDGTKWHYVCSVLERKHDQRCVLSLIERWWDTTHTFHLPNVELGFTPFDFTCITGIPVANGDLPPFSIADWGTLEKMQEFFPDLDGSGVDTSGIKCAYLKRKLEQLVLPVCQNAAAVPTLAEAAIETMWLRAFFLLVLGEIFFPVSKKWVSAGWFQAVEDPYAVHTFDWGTPILARMYSALDESCRRKVKSGQFFWTVLQYWYYEYIRIPAPVIRQPMDDVYPRILRWAPRQQQVVVGGVEHSLSACRRQLEEATVFSVLWQPFLSSPRIESERDCQNAYTVSQHRFVLNENGVCVWYLGDRCWRQLTGVPSVPQPPPQSMRVSVADSVRWIQRGEVPIPAEDLRIQVDDNGWPLYWRAVTRGTTSEEQGQYEVPQLPDLSQYFMDMTLAVPETSQRVQIPTEPYPLPAYAAPDQWQQLAQHLGQCAMGYRKALTEHYDRTWYPIDQYGFDYSADPSTTYPNTTEAPARSHQPRYRPSMDSKQHHNLGDDDDDDNEDECEDVD